MAKAKQLPVRVAIYNREFSTLTPEEELTFTVDELTLVHVLTGDELAFPVSVHFNRMIPMIEGCSVSKICSAYGETCETLFLPPGEYEFYFCDNGSAKFNPDGIFDISLILEPVSKDHALAETLNASNY